MVEVLEGPVEEEEMKVWVDMDRHRSRWVDRWTTVIPDGSNMPGAAHQSAMHRRRRRRLADPARLLNFIPHHTTVFHLFDRLVRFQVS